MSLLTPHEEREKGRLETVGLRAAPKLLAQDRLPRGELLEHVEERAELGGSKLVRGEDVERCEGRGEEILEHGLVQGDAHAAAAPEKIEAEERAKRTETRVAARRASRRRRRIRARRKTKRRALRRRRRGCQRQ